MITFTIRKGTKDDLQLSYDIMKNALGQYVIQTWGWDEDFQWQKQLNDFNPSILSIIEINGEPAASLEEEENANSITVCGIYITDKYQSMGIGEQLMNNVIDKAKTGGKVVQLQVLKVNTRAKKFYERLGFITIGENEFHHKMIYNKHR